MAPRCALPPARPPAHRGADSALAAGSARARPQNDILGDLYLETSLDAMISKWVFQVNSVTDSWPREALVPACPRRRRARALVRGR